MVKTNFGKLTVAAIALLLGGTAFSAVSASAVRKVTVSDGTVRTERLCGPVSQDYADANDAAYACKNRKDYAGALNALNPAIEKLKDFDSGKVLIGERAQIYYLLGQYDNAIADFLHQEKINYYNSFWIGDCYYRLKKYDLALASCDESLALKPDFANALGLKGRILFCMGDKAGALANLTQFLSRKPEEVIPSEISECTSIKSQLEH